MKSYKYNRYTIRLHDDVDTFIKNKANEIGIAPTMLIKSVLGEYKEREKFGGQREEARRKEA